MLKNEHYLNSQMEYATKALVKLDRAGKLVSEVGLIASNLDKFRFHSVVMDSLVDIMNEMYDQLECAQSEIEDEMSDLNARAVDEAVTAEKLLKVLFYAPNSPLSAGEADNLRVWYEKNKQAIKALKHENTYITKRAIHQLQRNG